MEQLPIQAKRMEVSVDIVQLLQRRQDRIRNLSILAHVDHGKTTLTDNLIASNGLIHPKLVGELRYLDSREDEQIRGITMKSSSISLVYHPKKDTHEEDVRKAGYLINLIDSPGHVDFCSEVSTAARLTDGCFIVVDAVEGVCIQTHAVLRQAWEEKVKPCLMVNKIDRLILSLEMSPAEIYLQLKQIVSQVNMIVSAFESEQFLSEANAVLAHEEAKDQAHIETENENEDNIFCPVKGNVVFGSAIDSWGFTIRTFANMYADKLGASPEALNKALWGDFQFQPKTKSVVKIKLQAKNQKTMFEQFILEPICNAYKALQPDADYHEILGKIIKGRGLGTESSRRLLTKDRKQSFKSVINAWLPLADAVLHTATIHLPSPLDAADERMTQLLSFQKNLTSMESDDIQTHCKALMNGLHTSSSQEHASCVIYISKMIAVDESWLPRTNQVSLTRPRNSQGNLFLAFGRVFSGVARKGMRIHVLSSGYDPNQPFTKHRKIGVLGDLYLMMGRGLEPLESAPAGNVLAIEGLEDLIHKSATLSTSPFCPPLVPMTFQCAAIVRVAVEPTLPSDLSKLENGLRQLSKADPFVEIEILPSGEHVVGAAGEVHLWTCLKDLKERYANIELEVSPPLVAFRETIENGSEERKVVHTTTSTGACEIRMRAHPLSDAFASFLAESGDVLQSLLVKKMENGLEEFRSKFTKLVNQESTENQNLLKRAWMLGPKRVGPNLLLTSNNSLFNVPNHQLVHLNKKRLMSRPGVQLQSKDENIQMDERDNMNATEPLETTKEKVLMESISIKMDNPEAARLLRLIAAEEKCNEEIICRIGEKTQGDIISGIIAGFQLATLAGPLCEEPMWGLLFEVDVQLHLPLDATENERAAILGEDIYGPFTGQVMTAMKSCCRQALMEAQPRLVEALYLAELSTSAEFLSGVYSVISRRRGRILREELREGSDVFIVHAYLPVEASFGLADELRSKSSGAASCSLLLSHWGRLDVDPFFVPKTEEEREEFGDEANLDSTNLAKKLMHSVRKRKGLVVQEKVVESATKQRTLAKKV